MTHYLHYDMANSLAGTVNSPLSTTIGTTQMLTDTRRRRIIEQDSELKTNELRKCVPMFSIVDN